MYMLIRLSVADINAREERDQTGIVQKHVNIQ